MILFRTGSITSAQPFPRAVKWQHLARHQDINWDSLSRLSDQELFAANGVEIVILDYFVTIRQIKLHLMTDIELVNGGRDSDFSTELEPETFMQEDPFIFLLPDCQLQKWRPNPRGERILRNGKCVVGLIARSWHPTFPSFPQAVQSASLRWLIPTSKPPYDHAGNIEKFGKAKPCSMSALSAWTKAPRKIMPF